jgi:hypothetical protein
MKQLAVLTAMWSLGQVEVVRYLFPQKYRGIQCPRKFRKVNLYERKISLAFHGTNIWSFLGYMGLFHPVR